MGRTCDLTDGDVPLPLWDARVDAGPLEEVALSVLPGEPGSGDAEATFSSTRLIVVAVGRCVRTTICSRTGRA